MSDARPCPYGGPPSGRVPVATAGASLLLLASHTASADEMPPWGRARAQELVDALLALAARHGFAQATALREKLTTDLRAGLNLHLATDAFRHIPTPELLKVMVAIEQRAFLGLPSHTEDPAMEPAPARE
ncbi:hypothetical protein [Burkholderia sp. BE17]|uniref:hypothetical protein n=1 Tax=Burkholderia sp. BE17 TaxID=2656644 RepID=UPI00128B6828|nr:hypothetical protein [Burkholderia sp. BE17]MPV68008.1 hypothetical protein [Burkholderia sp. BE17]